MPESTAAVAEPRIEKFERLVDELMKDDLEEIRVRKLMTDLGVDYTEDPIIRINRVLEALHNEK